MLPKNRFTFVSTLLVGACLSSRVQPALAADRMACDLITQTDVETVFHEKSESGGSPRDTVASSGCGYGLLGQSMLHFNIVLRKMSAGEFNSIMSVMFAAGLTPLTGVGEKAYENVKTGTIYVYSKGYQLNLQVLNKLTPSRMSEVMTDFRKLAERAAARL